MTMGIVDQGVPDGNPGPANRVRQKEPDPGPLNTYRMGIRDQRLYIFLSDIFLSFLDRRQRDAIPSDAAADVSVNVNGHRPLQP